MSECKFEIHTLDDDGVICQSQLSGTMTISLFERQTSVS